MSTSPHNLYDLTRTDLTALLARWDLSPVHAARLWSYLYLEGVTAIAEMPELPPKLRARLENENWLPRVLVVEHEAQSIEGTTRKYLLQLSDARRIETVLMRFRGRVTACISSQVGCAMGCVFCATGQMGYTRHLTAGEIVAQAMHVDRTLRLTTQGAALARPESDSPHERHERLRNIVLMGMGEPLHNYDAVLRAIDILRDSSGLGLGGKKITLSTVGVVPGIIRLADENRPMHLAVSLHAANQAERAALVPAAKKWPLDELMAACRYYIEKLQRRIFFEWTLIEGKNDSAAQAHEVGKLLRGLDAQVNLIPLNPTQGFDGEPTRSDAAKTFQAVLSEYNLPSTVRQRRGIDIAAGCGQLAVAKR